MAKDIMREGYGQVEPNHLSGIVEGRIYAQLPAAKVNYYTNAGVTTREVTPIDQLEQGQFAKYNYSEGVVDFGSDGEFMLVYNEEKLYDERRQNHKDFVCKASDFTDGKIYPRLIATEVGDIITTNTIEAANTSNEKKVKIGDGLTVGTYLVPSTSTGFLTIPTGGRPDSGMVWKIVKISTMPDGQPGFKIQRIQ